MPTVFRVRKIEHDDERKDSTFYLVWKPENIINESDIFYVSESISSTTISNIQKSVGECSSQIIDHIINISRINS